MIILAPDNVMLLHMYIGKIIFTMLLLMSSVVVRLGANLSVFFVFFLLLGAVS